MNILQMSPVEQDCVWQTVAGVIHLGNVYFDRKDAKDLDSEVLITGEALESVKNAARLFGCDLEALKTRLVTRTIRVLNSSTECVYIAGVFHGAEVILLRYRSPRKPRNKSLQSP